MKKRYNNFPYFVGIRSLEEVAPADATVCVMNIMGNESKKVTPVSHAFSGGNVVAGVQYGRPGKLETPIGDIPVYGRLADVVVEHDFDTGVIYLPPGAVFHAVAELLHYNKKLKRIIIVTEKLSVRDQIQIREICQTNEVDVFGANSLGVGDSWNKVRIGGALGGDKPEESLIKGTVAIHSNSGNFGNTIASYLKTAGFGTTTIVSSGKDKIIQFSVAEFLHAAQNDERTKAVVLYVEPGGYYEKEALDMIKSGELKFNKPIIACVTGRWKSKLTRAVGHAGALAGDFDDAETKEKWFDTYTGTEAFDILHPELVSRRGIRVSSIQHIPDAVRAVYNLFDLPVDFKPVGNLALKLWMGNDFGWNIPKKLQLPIVEAIPPYNHEIREFNRQLGAVYLRGSMRNASGASQMDPGNQITKLHGIPVTKLVDEPMESNMIFALLKFHPNSEQLPFVNMSLNYLSSSSDFYFDAIELSEKNGATPNEALMAAISMMGDHEQFGFGRKYIKFMLDILTEMEVKDLTGGFNHVRATKIGERVIPLGRHGAGPFAKRLVKLFNETKSKSKILTFAIKYLVKHRVEYPDIFLIAAFFVDLAFKPLVLRRITRDTVENMIAYLGVQSRVVLLAGVRSRDNDYLNKIRNRRGYSLFQTSFTEVAFRSIFQRKPKSVELQEFKALLALTLTNGPGTISAKGAKESVSARNNISTAFAGFMANTGLAHGGAGFEAIEFLLDAFKDEKISSPGIIGDIDTAKISNKVAIDFLNYKTKAKQKGSLSYKRIPCVNHPVFKGKPINVDPREEYIYKHFKSLEIDNIFWDFYHDLVQSLYDVGASSNVYCVNIDAVIAVISLKLMWNDYLKKSISDAQMQKIGFVIFLLGRMTGVSSEIADHRNRGQDMDTRTPASQTRFVY